MGDSVSEEQTHTSSFVLWKRMMGYLRPYRFWATVALAGVIGNNILMIVVPMILRDVIDRGVELQDSAFMLSAGLVVVGLGLLRGITGFMFRYYGERQSLHIAYDIRNEMYRKVLSLQFSYHDNAQVGTIITRAISDVNEIQRYFAFGLIDGLNTGLLFLGIAIVMFYASPPLAIVALVPMIPLGYFSRRFVREIHPRWRGIMDLTQKLSNHLQENALGAQVVRVFAREKYEISKFAEQNAVLYAEQLGFVKLWASYLPLSAFIAASSTAFVLFFGGWFIQEGIGDVTVGMVVSFNAYVLLLAQPMRFLGFVILLTTQAIASSERVFEIIDVPETITSKPDAQVLENISGHIEMNGVRFAYNGASKDVLKNINLSARPGQVTALLGSTGSGKTSLINLIPRFYDVSEGAVTIDGVDVRNIDLHNLRSHIGIVLQESLLFSATIHENIAYGRPDASRETVIAAAMAANAHDFIMEFADGYETEVGERGVTLSGGQRQRIAIARALLINPRILILDDATSSVDTRTEFLIQQALDRLMAGRTTFVIAQRLSTVINADQILVLNDGEIVERGTHAELVENGKLYAEIYELQLAEQERLRRESLLLTGKPLDFEDDKRSTKEFKVLIDRLGGSD